MMLHVIENVKGKYKQNWDTVLGLKPSVVLYTSCILEKEQNTSSVPT